MTKTELLHALVEYKDTKANSPGIQNIIQLVVDILVEDISADSKKYLKEDNS